MEVSEEEYSALMKGASSNVENMMTSGDVQKGRRMAVATASLINSASNSPESNMTNLNIKNSLESNMANLNMKNTPESNMANLNIKNSPESNMANLNIKNSPESKMANLHIKNSPESNMANLNIKNSPKSKISNLHIKKYICRSYICHKNTYPKDKIVINIIIRVLNIFPKTCLPN